jgi:hypothetical protein
MSAISACPSEPGLVSGCQAASTLHFPKPILLLVEPHPGSLYAELHRLLDAQYQVTSVQTDLQVFLLRSSEINFAILSAALGTPTIRAVAESVRRQWPSARILILGNAQMVLDDHMYDEAVGGFADSERIFAAVQGFSVDTWTQRAAILERSHMLANPWAFAVIPGRTRPSESDPSKASPKDLVDRRQEISDMPTRGRPDRSNGNISRREA